jgi:hypothetical protein
VKEERHEGPSFDPRSYPALQDFFPAYLHEDFGDEYGSAAGAVNAFVGEASGDEILQVKEEWQLLRNAFRGVPLGEFQNALRKLGSGWSPVDERELETVEEILSSAQA